MLLGLSIGAFTTLHVIISLVGIASGLVVLALMLGGRPLGAINAIFLLTTILTSATGYLFPASAILPSHIVGAISLVALALALFALYGRHAVGAWRPAYAGLAVFALYLNCFVAVAQGFLKLPALHALAPTQGEPPFAIVQGLVLVAFIVLGVLAAKRYRPAG